MRKIHQLPSHIIAKIAAGEVIERPAYAVKELLDNAIDAHANSITIQVDHAGLNKIIVRDDGEGMSREDVGESFKPHTTSKLSIDDELSSIQTLGFRGEALASIAGVSTVIIKSRPHHAQTGTAVTIRNTILENTTPIGMPIGTTVIITDLFTHLQARKKFLKSLQTEFRYIVDMVTNYALAYPHIGFSLTHNHRLIFDFPKLQSIVDRMRKLFGYDISENLIPLQNEEAYLHIHGFISKPQITTIGTRKHFIFVNNRIVNDKAITQTIKDAYGNLLESTAFPIFIMFLTLPYEAVDVNVHPRKEQVHFMNSTDVNETIARTVKQTLIENNLTFQKSRWEKDTLYDRNTGKLFAPRYGNIHSYEGMMVKDEVIPWDVREKTTIIHSASILQLHSLYLLVQTKHGMLLIDQHAAHERILYEQYKHTYEHVEETVSVFQLSEPLSFDLSPNDTEILYEHQDIFKKLGFIIEHFRDTTFTIQSIPALLKDRNIKTIIREILEDISQEKTIRIMDKTTTRMLSYLACRAAIKSGDKLTKEQSTKLLEQLEKTQNNATCPHGRPTKIEIPLSTIHRMFKRK